MHRTHRDRVGRVVLRCLPTLAALAFAAGTGATVSHWEHPAPYARGSGRLVVATGSGRQRVSLFAGRSQRGELCVAARLGPGNAPPAAGYTCLRRGLEPPALPIELGGEDPSGARSAAVVGLADQSVGSVELDLQDNSNHRLPLRRVPGVDRWRVFAFGPTTSYERGMTLEGRLPDSLTIRDRHGEILLDQAGIVLLGPCEVRNDCGPRGRVADAPWTREYDWFEAGTEGAKGRATDLALREPALHTVLAAHAAWLDMLAPWTACNGRSLGYVVAFRFRRRATFRATLPFVASPKGNAAYASGVEDVLAVRSAGVSVWVDLNRNRVVGVDAASADALDDAGIATPLRVRVPARDAGGPDTGDCWSSGD